MPISTINTNSISDDAVTVPKVTDQVLTHRNLIINGAMQVAQRGAGPYTQTASNQYGLDRFDGTGTITSKFTFEQSSVAPAGFFNSTLITSLSAYSVLTGDFFVYRQRVEGLNCSYLGWGTASAKTVTLSFWVRSSLTGNFGGYFTNSAFNRSLPFSYTINSADTWEHKSVTVLGDTSGTWLTTNSIGIEVGFSLGAGATYSATANTWAGNFYCQPTGSTSVVGTSGATLYITGVQLEVGDTATPFEHRSYADEFARCQRYYEYGRIVQIDTTVITGSFVVLKRAAPTMTRLGNTWTASEGGTFGPFDNSAYYVQSGGTSYVGGQWSADAEL